MKTLMALFVALVAAVGWGADAAPALRYSGYINGKLNVVVASTADYQNSQVEVQVYQNGDWQTVTDGSSRGENPSFYTADVGWTEAYPSVVWTAPLAATDTVSVRYRVATGGLATDWSAAFEVTPSVAAVATVMSAPSNAANTMDGDVFTSFLGNNGAFEYDLGSVCEIAAIRFAPVLRRAAYLPSMKIEAANRADFADAQTLVEFGYYGAKLGNCESVLDQLEIPYKEGLQTLNAGWKVKTFDLPQPVSARYFRVSRPQKAGTGGDSANQWADRDSGYFAFADVEFSLASGVIQAPAVSVGLNAASAVPYNDRVPVITYNAAAMEGVTFTVERATSFGGPYAAIAAASTAASASVRDESSLPGVLYYYRVKAESGNVASYSDVVSHLRDRRLERDSNDLTQLASGVADIISDTANTFYRGPMKNAFDGDTGTTTSTASSGTSMWNYWANPFVGVNLGKDCYLTGCAVIYGYSGDGGATAFNITHVNNGSIKVYGTANSAGPFVSGNYNWKSNPPDVTGGKGCTALADVGALTFNQWKYLPIDDAGVYRTVYLSSANGSAWVGNVSEIGFFGYSEAERAAAYADIVTAPTETGAEMTGDGVRVTWSGAQNATGFRVDRREAGAELWRAASGTLAAGAESFTDASVSSATYEYRVTALKGDADGGYAMPVTVVAYPLGNGTGLRADYVWPYLQTGYDASEAVVATSMTAAPEVDWADGAERIDGVADATANVRVVYRGKLIVPQDGFYGFRLSATDGAALRIDGASLVNQWDASAAARVSEATLTLTAGEHDIRLDTWQGAGARSMRLEWKMGDGVFGAIPLRQLKPTADAFSEAVAVRLANGNRTEMWTAR